MNGDDGDAIGVTWCGPDGEAVEVPEPPDEPYYAPIGEWQQGAYERNAFTRGTAQEAAFLMDVLRLKAGARLLDVGCGTGRHVAALHRQGVRCTGVDISFALLRDGQRQGPQLVHADARRLPFGDGSFDVVLSLCQGAFGITPGSDEAVLAEMVRVLRSPGKMALTAFSLEFAARWMAEGDALDVSRGLHHHRADVRNSDGASQAFDLWTRCYGASEITRVLEGHGLEVHGIFGVAPGAYARRPPRIDLPEHFLFAMKP